MEDSDETEERETMFALARLEIDKLDAANRALRKLLWLTHGCGVLALYGDDGEMSCGKCMTDFKRMSVEEIEASFHRRSLPACNKCRLVVCQCISEDAKLALRFIWNSSEFDAATRQWGGDVDEFMHLIFIAAEATQVSE